MRPLASRFALLLGALLLLGACGGDDDSNPCVVPLDTNVFPSSSVSFQTDIVPIFNKATCSNQICHGNPPAASNYDTRTVDELMKAGTVAKTLGKCGIVRGDPGASYLVDKLKGPAGSGVRMPDGQPPLSAAEIAKVEQWIREGAHP